MRVIAVCLVLALSLTLGLCVRSPFPGGVYVFTRLETLSPFVAMQKLNAFAAGANSLKQNYVRGPLIVQGERLCPVIGELKWKYVYSQRLYNVSVSSIPVPDDDTVHLDFKLGLSRNMQRRSFLFPVPLAKLLTRVEEFYNETPSAQKNWFYVSDFSALNTTTPKFGVMLIEQSRYPRRSCPPDDSNYLKLCSKSSPYQCPPMRDCHQNGIHSRHINITIVTSHPASSVLQNCSFGDVVMDQYIKNHYYFYGQNSRHLKMKRTIPVIYRVSDTPPTTNIKCNREYQMQFYVSNPRPPCPNDTSLQLLTTTDLEVYVKVFHGSASSDMSFLRDHFQRELTEAHLSFVPSQYYLSVYRGTGPIFGRRLELWILKNEAHFCTAQCYDH
ncbi:hypothetical protein Ahia01_001182100 [Argonauta hians]